MSDAPAVADPQVPKRSRRFWFRVATSICFFLLTVALCVLWVSGFPVDSDSWFGFDVRGKYYSINWPMGNLGMFSVLSKDHGQGNDAFFFGGRHQPLQGVLGFRLLVFDNGWAFNMPMWFPVLVSSTLGVALWPSWQIRFSLRTLLITTTLVAVALALLVWTMRS